MLLRIKSCATKKKQKIESIQKRVQSHSEDTLEDYKCIICKRNSNTSKMEQQFGESNLAS